MLTGYDVYCRYLGMKLHFQEGSTYDYLKYGPRKVKHETYEFKNNHKYMYSKLTKYSDQELNLRLALMFFYNEKAWIGSIFEPEMMDKYSDWQKRIDGYEYWLQQDRNILEADGHKTHVIEMAYNEEQLHPVTLCYFVEAYKHISQKDMIAVWVRQLSKNETNAYTTIPYAQKIGKISPFLGLADKNIIRNGMKIFR